MEPIGDVTVFPPVRSVLHRQLSPFGVWLLALSCLSPVFSVYGVGGDVLVHAGTGTVLLFLVGLGAALLWGFVYAELGSAFPYAGGDYVGVGPHPGRLGRRRDPGALGRHHGPVHRVRMPDRGHLCRGIGARPVAQCF